VFAALEHAQVTAMRLPRRAAAIAAVAALIITAVALVVLDPSALSAGPAIALLILLAARRYPGERALIALSVSGDRPRPRRLSAAQPHRDAEIATPRGGLLLACSLAVRPPPAPVAAA
jgi:hypothetical protein